MRPPPWLGALSSLPAVRERELRAGKHDYLAIIRKRQKCAILKEGTEQIAQGVRRHGGDQTMGTE